MPHRRQKKGDGSVFDPQTLQAELCRTPADQQNQINRATFDPTKRYSAEEIAALTTLPAHGRPARSVSAPLLRGRYTVLAMRRRLTQEVPSFQQLPLDGIEAIIMGNNEVRYVQEVTADTDRKNIDTRLIKTALRAGSTACRDTMLVCGRPFIMPSPVIGDTRLHLAMGLQPARDHSEPYKAARSFARGVLLNLVTTNTAIPLAKTRNDTTLGRSEVAMSLGTVESPDVLQALNERHLGYFSAMYADQELLFGQPVVRTEATQVPQTAFGSS